ncbi:hypothetical protein [Streptacidiphilus melanogenes]|nr:hypothetical protein [Streptacidiphilus melanogenes]
MNRDGHSMSVDLRETRRDLHAWRRASMGNSGEDASWMHHLRR